MKLPLWLRNPIGRRTKSRKRSLPLPKGRWSRLILEPLEERVLLDAAAEHFIDRVYRDLLHRPAEAFGLGVWSGALARGATRAEVVRAIEACPEPHQNLVGGTYQAFLRRPADGFGLNLFVTFLDGGGPPDAVRAGVLGSPEYVAAQTNGTADGFVTAVYRDVLGRSVDAVGHAAWDSLLANGVSPITVALGILTSLEARQQRVQGFYQQFLRRSADDHGLQSWVGLLQRGGREEDVVAGILGSAEYAARVGSAPPAVPRFDLAAASDTAPVGDHATTLATVTLAGQTDPGIDVILVGTGARTVSTATGTFTFTGVPLTLGDNPFSVRATDSSGNSAEFSLTIRRLEVTTTPNAVLVWNHTLLEAVRLDASAPPVASRGMAIVHAAILDAVNAIEGTPARYVALSAPHGASEEAAVAAAAHRVLGYLYPAQQASFDAALATSLGQVANGQAKTDGIALGQAAADAIIALRAHDGFDKFVAYVSPGGLGDWQPTAPMFAPALLPQWATLQPFAMTSPDQFRAAGPPDLASQTWADDFNDVKSLGRADSSTRTAEQTQIARFWADGSGSYTPPGHWNQIAAQVAQQHGDTLAQDALLFATLNLTLADAAIVAWDAKYVYNTWRPITAIQQAATTGNDRVQADATWSPLLITPPFPEYISGHSTFSGAAATVLDAFFGPAVGFSTTSLTLPNVTRSFASFDAAAAEAGRSRIYGGIHFEFANQDGQAAGRSLAQYVLDTFSSTTDTMPPQVLLSAPVSGLATAANLTVQGHVLDNLSGVATLEAQLDGSAFSAVAFDARGNFTLPTTLALDGSADGAHVLRFRATDAARNVSPGIVLAFTLDTRAPLITLDGLADGGSINARTQLTGTADGTGSAITRLTYRLDGGTDMPVAFDRVTGQFAQALDLSRLAAGQHTLAVNAQDAAGQLTAVSLTVSLAAAIPFDIHSFTPLDGAQDVGTTFRPQVFFARPVDPTSLTADNFFATGPSGAKLPARIVPAGDGSFAWLFFTGPMPGSAQITVHVLGDSIRASADGASLDADMDMMPGGSFTYAFSTVSLTPLLGTSLSGKVVDPGPDLHAMTFDDIRAGPDQILHTADDVFLLPIAGVKVFIVGLEDRAVFTDAAGNFHFDAVPAGDVKLAIDGRTATNAPAGFFFPEMVMDLMLEAGRANTAMGSMGTAEEQRANRDRQELYLPRIRTSILRNVSNTEPTMIGVDAAAAPNITAQQRQMLTIEVQPGSLLDQNGNPVTAGQVGISTVPPEMVRDMLPAGLLQHTFDITVQAPGITNFSTPAPMTFPNLFGAAPGSQLNFLSFDHTTGRLVIEGTATVSADGLSVHTDPGTGITHPGWHGLAPPGSPTGPQCTGGGATEVTPIPVTLGVQDYFFSSDDPTFTLSFGNAAKAIDETSDPCSAVNATATPLEIQIEVDGDADEFLTGLAPGKYVLLPQQQFSITVGMKTLLFPYGISTAFENRLYGVRIHITGHQQGLKPSPLDPLLLDKTIYVYRFLDIADDNHTDREIDFEKTFVGLGPAASQRKALQLPIPNNVRPSVEVLSSLTSPFGVTAGSVASRPLITFRPTIAGPADDFLKVLSPDGIPVGLIRLRGRGVTAQTVLLPKAELATAIANVLDNQARLAPNAPPFFAGVFPADSNDAGSKRSDEPGFQPALDALYATVVQHLRDTFNQIGAEAGTNSPPLEILDTSAGPGILATFGAKGDPDGPHPNAVASSEWVDFDISYFNDTLVPQIDTTSVLQQKWRFDSKTNKSFSDVEGVEGQIGTLRVNLQPVAVILLKEPTKLATFLTNLILHEIGHDLGNIHLQDAAHNYIAGDGDVMGKTEKDVFQTFVTFRPVVKLALGLPIDEIDFLKVRNYYQTYAKPGAYGNGVEAPNPEDPDEDLIATVPVLTAFNGPLVVGQSLPEQVHQVDFGTVGADGPGNEQGTLRLYLFNDGGADLDLTAVRLLRGNAHFSVQGAGTLPLSLPPIDPDDIRPDQSTYVLTVYFDPTAPGEATDVLRIESNRAGGRPLDIPLKGTGQRTTADLREELFNNNFGGVAVGQLRDEPGVGAFLKNYGVLPVTITAARVPPGPGENEFFIEPFQPITLQPGESYTVRMNFRPSAAGLRRGLLEILSDDPQNPIIRKSLVGTGLLGGNLDLGNDFVAVGSVTRQFDNTPVLRQRSDAGGHWEFFLAAESLFEVVTFDPASGLVAHGFVRTNPAGQRTEVNSGVFQASVFPDSDGDGLPDDIEFAIGTDPKKIDTDGDGITDFAAINLGLNPLSDRPAVTGVIAGLKLDGQARDLVLGSDPADPRRQLAYVATFGTGLAIIDVTRFDRPLLVSQLGLSGVSVAVAVDSGTRIAAVAAQDVVHFISIADPTRPQLLNTFPIKTGHVELFEGLAYLASESDLIAFDPVAGEEVQRLSLGGSIVQMRRDGAALFVVTDGVPETLRAVDLSGLAMVARGSLALSRSVTFVQGDNFFVAGGVAWFPSISPLGASGGLLTVNVGSLDNLTLISDVVQANFLPYAAALNGSGLGIVLASGATSTGGSQPVVYVVDASDPRNAAAVFTQFGLPDVGRGVALASGLAYVADQDSGLQVINYLAFDQGGQPPTITLNLVEGDLDPARPGLQLLEASAVNLTARITDDVQVRNVELLVNGVVVRNEISYPYDFSTTLPKIADGGSGATLQLRATDTGGNVQISAPVLIELVPDTIPPTIASLEPPEGSTQPLSFRKITIQFSEPLDTANVNATNFELIGPAGAVTPLSVRTRQRGSSFEFVYAPLEGAYQFVIHAPQVHDRVGNPLGAGDVVRSFRVGNIVRVPTINWIGAASGFWDDVNNWDAGRLPGEQDDVKIDVPGGGTITLRNANPFPEPPFESTVRSLVSNNAFSITSGSLTVTETMQVNNTFTLHGMLSGDLERTIATLNATVLRGTGGQGLTIGGVSRLEECVIQTDIALAADSMQLRIKGGLALLGTATLAGARLTRIGFEGTQTITQGVFVFSGNSHFTTMESIGDATVTFGPDVTLRGVGGGFFEGLIQPLSRFTLINYGRILADGASPSGDSIEIRTTDFTNHGILEARNGAGLIRNSISIDSSTWSNAADGQIRAVDGGSLGLGRESVSWSNAGLISATSPVSEFNESQIFFGSYRQSTTRWSNTGSIFSRDCVLYLGGTFSSAAVENLRRSGGLVFLNGTMDNNGRTFTFDEPKGSWLLQGGTILGGTLVLNTPVATLDIDHATLDGVTINGLLEVGLNHQEAAGAAGFYSQLLIRNGLTVNGTISISDIGTNPAITFVGSQTVTGGTFVSLEAGNYLGGGALQAKDGEVTLDANVTVVGGSVRGVGLLDGVPFSGGSFVNLGTMIANSRFLPSSLGVREITNRGLIRVNRDGALFFAGVNEGRIELDHASLVYLGNGVANSWQNTGIVDAVNSHIELRGNLATSAIGDLRNPGGQTIVTNELDNTGATLNITASTGNWVFADDGGNRGLVLGGTVRIDPAASLEAVRTTLKDVTIEGDLRANDVGLAGDVTIHGIVRMNDYFDPPLVLGDENRFPDLPLTIHSGIFDLGRSPSGGSFHKSIVGTLHSSGDITFGPDVVLHADRTDATFVRPLLNLGQIIAEPAPFVGFASGINFTNTTITNRGVLSSNGGSLQVAQLAPNEATILARAGGTVVIGGNLPQASTATVTIYIAGQMTSQFGRVTVAGAASLAGTLNVQFTGGFTPATGNTFQVMTYASVNETFGTVNVTGLPPGLVATAVYGPTSLSIVVGMALQAGGPPPGQSTGLSPLTGEQVQVLLDAAITHWAAAGLTAQQLDLLGGVVVRVADLGNNLLGLAAGNVITLDDDAAGNGWFVDPTPLENEEFRAAADHVFAALADGPAAGRMDLLTVVMHELGHLAGLDDLDGTSAPDQLMTESLTAGIRRLP